MQRMSDIVNAARRRVERLSPQQVANELSCGADLLLVDIRESDELDATGRIDRAVHVSTRHARVLADPTRTRALAELRPERRVILYSESGDRSALAAAALQDIGYERVAHLDGGLRAWRDSGFATTSDVELVAEDDRSPRPRPRATTVRVSFALVAALAIGSIVAGAAATGGARRPPIGIRRAGADAQPTRRPTHQPLRRELWLLGRGVLTTARLPVALRRATAL